jgi:hypothetical protein
MVSNPQPGQSHDPNRKMEGTRAWLGRHPAKAVQDAIESIDLELSNDQRFSLGIHSYQSDPS